MALSINIGSSRGKRWEMDLSMPPVEKVQKGSTFFGLFIVIFALFWGGMPLIGLVEELRAGRFGEETILFLIFPIIGVGILLFGIHNLLWRRTIAFDGQTFTVNERGLKGTREWHEPLSAYRGVMRHTRQVRTKNSSYTLYMIDLVHADSDRNINLYTDTREGGFREKWEAFARRLNLPALEEGAGGMVRREAGDLDKSVGELIREGKVDIDYNSLVHKAEGVAVGFEGDVTVITRTGPAHPWWGLVIGPFLPLIFIGVAVYAPDMPFLARAIFGGVGALAEVIVIGAIIRDLLSRQRLRVGPAGVWVNRAYAKSETDVKRIEADEIETVRLVKNGNNLGSAVEIAGDRDKLTFGGGLPGASLEFVMNTILAKIKETERYRRR